MYLKSLLRLSRLVTIVLPSILLLGCFGEGSGPTPIAGTALPPRVGILVNSPVEGATFTTATQSGITNASGEYQYLPGEMVTFSVGGIVLGTVTAAPIITPVELTGSVDPTVQAATNQLVFLQSIDEDQNHATGITISAATQAAAAGLSLDFTSPTFAAEVATVVAMIAPGNAVVSETDALDNFYQTYVSFGGTNTFSWLFPGYPPVPGTSVNLLTNGSFESPDASAGDVPCSANWSCFNFNFTTSNNFMPGGSFVNPTARTGTQVLKQFGGDGGAFQIVPATPGSTYTASAHAMNWTGDEFNNLALVQLTFLDAGGAQIGPAFEVFGDTLGGVNTLLAPTSGGSPSDWTALSVQGVAPAGTVSAKILLLHILTPPNPSSGSIYWDDVSLNGPPPVPTNTDLLTNGSFESPDASAGDVPCSDNWSCFNFNFTTSNNFMPGGSFVNPTARTGTQVLKQFGGDGGAFQIVPATPGSSYTATAHAMNWTGDEFNNLALVQLTFLDAGGAQIGPAFEVFGDTIGGVNTLLAPTSGGSPSDWTALTVQGVAPAGTVSAQILLLHILTPPNPSSGSIYWDDVSLTGPTSGTPPTNFQLVFADEFNGTALDTSNWTYETGYGPNNNGWGNDEWQLYTTNSANISVTGGNLVISAQCATAPACGIRDGTITSAKINTLNSFNFKYGKVQARIQPAVGVGTWPAFWMLGTNFPVVGWPEAGEVDIMEIFSNGSNNRTAHFTMHWCDESLGVGCAFPNGYASTTNFIDTGSSLGNDFHVFEAEWDASGITGKIDGTAYFTSFIQPATMEEFLDNFYMILNLAIGGTLGGAPDATTTWPQTMLVDYVRVYQAIP